MAGVIRMELPVVTLTLNERQRLHWRKIQALQRSLAWEMRLALGRNRPAVPFARARVTIERHSTGTPDHDNLVGGMKDLIDGLLVPLTLATKPGSAPRVLHAFGLSLVADDAPAVLVLEVRSVRIRRGTPVKTVITIEELGAC